MNSTKGMLIHCRTVPDWGAFYRLPDWVKLRRKQNFCCPGFSFSLRTHDSYGWRSATSDIIIDKAL